MSNINELEAKIVKEGEISINPISSDGKTIGQTLVEIPISTLMKLIEQYTADKVREAIEEQP